jgi:hypothetical protein
VVGADEHAAARVLPAAAAAWTRLDAADAAVRVIADLAERHHVANEAVASSGMARDAARSPATPPAMRTSSVVAAPAIAADRRSIGVRLRSAQRRADARPYSDVCFSACGLCDE